jgi:hypothetical protein
MNVKKIAATVTIAGAVGGAALGLGAGTVQADPHWGPNIPWIPGPGDWVDWNPYAPGQIKNTWCPWLPPGHWHGGPHGWPCVPGW